MHKILLLVAILFFSGCNFPQNEEKTGYLIDSAISGVQYQCDDIQGETQWDGKFTYHDSCTVVFTVGGILIGQIKGIDIYDDGKVLPADLIGISRDNIEDETLIFILRFLQTLDKDNNPNNQIEVPQNYRIIFEDSKLDLTALTDGENELSTALSHINKKLISKNNALAHYKNTLKKEFDIEIETPSSFSDIETPNEVEENKVVSTYSFVPNSQEDEESLEVESNSSPEIEEKEPVETEALVQEEVKAHVNEVTVRLETEEIEEVKEDTGFSYENQRDITIHISAQNSINNKQVLLYEEMSMTSTPVGDFEQLKNVIISTVFNEDGELNLTYTLGNHITSVWLVVPFYGLTIEIPINNNMVYLKLDN